MSILETGGLISSTYVPVQPVDKVHEVQRKQPEQSVEETEQKPIVPEEKAFDRYERTVEENLAESKDEVAEYQEEVSAKAAEKQQTQAVQAVIEDVTFEPWRAETEENVAVKKPSVTVEGDMQQTVGSDTAERVATTITNQTEVQTNAIERDQNPNLMREVLIRQNEKDMETEVTEDPRPQNQFETYQDRPTYQQNSMELGDTLDETALEYDPEPPTPPPGVDEINLADQFSEVTTKPRETTMEDTPIQQKAHENYEKEVSDELQVKMRDQAKLSAVGNEDVTQAVETQPQVQEALAVQGQTEQPTVEVSSQEQPVQERPVAQTSEVTGASERAEVSRETAQAPERIQPQTRVEPEQGVEPQREPQSTIDEEVLVDVGSQVEAPVEQEYVSPETTVDTESVAVEPEIAPLEDYFPELPGTSEEPTTSEPVETVAVPEPQTQIQPQTQVQTSDVAAVAQTVEVPVQEEFFAPLPGSGETVEYDVFEENPVFNAERSGATVEEEPSLQDFLGEGVSVVSQQDMAFFRTTATSVQMEQLDAQFSTNDDSAELFEQEDPQTEEWYQDSLNRSTLEDYGVRVGGEIDLSEVEVTIHQNQEATQEAQSMDERIYSTMQEQQVTTDREDTTEEAKEITTFFGVDS